MKLHNRIHKIDKVSLRVKTLATRKSTSSSKIFNSNRKGNNLPKTRQLRKTLHNSRMNLSYGKLEETTKSRSKKMKKFIKIKYKIQRIKLVPQTDRYSMM
jgi:hypothetical protein